MGGSVSYPRLNLRDFPSIRMTPLMPSILTPTNSPELFPGLTSVNKFEGDPTIFERDEPWIPEEYRYANLWHYTYAASTRACVKAFWNMEGFAFQDDHSFQNFL